MIANPEIQTLKDCLVFLHNKQPRALLRSDAQIHCELCVEVTFLGSVGRVIRANRWVTIYFSYSNDADILWARFRFKPEKPFIKSHLSLGSKVIVKAR